MIVAVMVICALFAPQIAPNDPANQDLANMLLPPMWSAGRHGAISVRHR